MLSQEVQLTNHGKSEVHLTGYKTTTEVMDPEADLLDSDEDDDEDPEEILVGGLSLPCSSVIPLLCRALCLKP